MQKLQRGSTIALAPTLVPKPGLKRLWKNKQDELHVYFQGDAIPEDRAATEKAN